MTDMTHEEIRDALPDLIHTTVDTGRRKQIEDHLRACAECASEMRVLQMVKGAPSFAPMIDAVAVSSKILPYGGIPAERPRRTTRMWQMLAAVAVVAVLAVTLMSRSSQEVRGPAVSPSRVAAAPTTVASPAALITRTDSPASNAVATARKARELQVAVGLDGLSDGNLAQLASDLGGLDGLPSPDPENLGVADPNPMSGGGE